MSMNEATTERLEKLLADTYALALKSQNYHWNVEGVNFVSLHALFETNYAELSGAVDEIAERIRALGAFAPGGLQSFLSLTSIADAKGQLSDRQMVADLAAGHESIATDLKTAIPAVADAGDEGTADLMIRRLQAHQKAAWILKSVLA